MTTVIQRLTQAGIPENRAAVFLAHGWIRVDRRTVTDPQADAQPPARIVIQEPSSR